MKHREQLLLKRHVFLDATGAQTDLHLAPEFCDALGSCHL
jgi:hypothetical protein